jgi:hypothetical protein
LLDTRSLLFPLAIHLRGVSRVSGKSSFRHILVSETTMPSIKAATNGSTVKGGEPAAKKTRTTRGGASITSKPLPPLITAPPDDAAGPHVTANMDVDSHTLGSMNGYGSLKEEEMGWAELLKQGYAQGKSSMNGFGKDFALSDDVKTIDVSRHPLWLLHTLV